MALHAGAAVSPLPDRQRRGSARALLLIAAAVTAGGCTVLAPSTRRAPAPSAAGSDADVDDDSAGLATALAIERRWLQSWFGGTPVTIAQHRNGTLEVQVPRDFCFDRGRDELKAPLVAVLEKVAESLRRRPDARLTVLAAPDDAPRATTLAMQRGAVVRQRLLTLGVAADRLSAPTPAGRSAVQLWIGAGTR